MTILTPNIDNSGIMKKFLKFAGVFVLGLALGFVIAFYLTQKELDEFYGNYISTHAVFDISVDTDKLRHYRRKTESGERFFKMLETSIPEHILLIEKNEELKKSSMYGSLLISAKEFYICTKTPVPKEIEGIISKVELGKDFECEPELTENDDNKGGK